VDPENVRAIAFFLPQFHPIPENDAWWGKGFTEWRNVAQAKPLFPGHYQPHIPADLGFYDLRLAETREAQAALAREYGIHGFCYYHYWFNGRRILERPFNEVLSSGKPDFPFCLCWANENWTRAWDGGSENILLAQHHSPEGDLDHIRELIPALRDDRYIRVNGKPLLLVYRTEIIPDPVRMTEIWREEAIRECIGELYLARVESFSADIAPKHHGFDAAVEFAPDWRNKGAPLFRGRHFDVLTKLGLFPDVYANHHIFKYDSMIQAMLQKPEVDYIRLRCVTPGWDNSPRRSQGGAAIFTDSTPERYQTWLCQVVSRTRKKHVGDERIVFINAWNEWAESNHLEPDLRWGHAYLQATLQALKASGEAGK
jgi:lipopolysaccharide biosynthesis protein